MSIITKYIPGYITIQNLFSLDLNRTVQGNHNTAKTCITKCTTKRATCCTVKCVLVLLNRRKIKFTSSVEFSSY